MTDDEMISALVRKHEGCRLTAYMDVTGYACGWGCHGPDITKSTVWTQQEADARLTLEIGHCEADVQGLFGKATPTGARLAALIDIRFNVGEHGFSEFVRMIAAVRDGDWWSASHECANSKAAEELPGRYAEDSVMLRTGLPPTWMLVG